MGLCTVMKLALVFAADTANTYGDRKTGSLGSLEPLPHGGTGSARRLDWEAVNVGAEVDAG